MAEKFKIEEDGRSVKVKDTKKKEDDAKPAEEKKQRGNTKKEDK